MANRPSLVSIAVYIASADGRFYPRYPNGSAPVISAQLTGIATATISSVAAFSIGAGFVASASIPIVGTASLTTVPFQPMFAGVSSVPVVVTGSLTTTIKTQSTAPAIVSYVDGEGYSGGAGTQLNGTGGHPLGLTTTTAPLTPAGATKTQLTAGNSLLAIASVSTYESLHNGYIFNDKEGNTYQQVNSVSGWDTFNTNGWAPTPPPSAVNQAQLNVIYFCQNVLGTASPNTYYQHWTTNGVAIANQDLDDQTFFALELSNVNYVVGSEALAQNNIAINTNFNAGAGVVVGAADVPCIQIAMACNVNDSYLPNAPNLASGSNLTAMGPGFGNYEAGKYWAAVGNPTDFVYLTVGYRNITTAGTYQALFTCEDQTTGSGTAENAPCFQVWNTILSGNTPPAVLGRNSNSTVWVNSSPSYSNQISYMAPINGKYIVGANDWGPTPYTTWVNNERDWGVTGFTLFSESDAIHCYPFVNRGWVNDQTIMNQLGANWTTTCGMGVQCSALTKCKVHWSITTPTAVSNKSRWDALIDIYFHTMQNPGTNQGTSGPYWLPYVDLQIFHMDMDNGYYADLLQNGFLKSFNGVQYGVVIDYGSVYNLSGGHTITMVTRPNAQNDSGTSQLYGRNSCTHDVQSIIRWFGQSQPKDDAGNRIKNYNGTALGAVISPSLYLTAINAGFEVDFVQNGTDAFTTKNFWVAMQNEPDGNPLP